MLTTVYRQNLQLADLLWPVSLAQPEILIGRGPKSCDASLVTFSVT